MINPPVDKIDSKKSLILSVLSHILLLMSASPLRKALVDSVLGKNVVGNEVETELRQTGFGVESKVVNENGIEKRQVFI